MIDKADVLAEFFSSVFSKEPEGEIPNLQPKETKFRCAEHQIEEKEVLKLLSGVASIEAMRQLPH